jgi:hypothetical protein
MLETSIDCWLELRGIFGVNMRTEDSRERLSDPLGVALSGGKWDSLSCVLRGVVLSDCPVGDAGLSSSQLSAIWKDSSTTGSGGALGSGEGEGTGGGGGALSA